MEWMDRYRRFAGALWVAVGLVILVVGLAGGGTRPGLVTCVLTASIAALAVLAVLSPSGLATGVAARVAATLLGLDLVGAVLDRVGVLGAPGSPGVSLGDWSHFEDYTATLLHHPASWLVSVAAVGATVVEIVAAAALVSGWQRRWVAKAVAGLFVIYLVTMLCSAARDDVARYDLPVLIGGALLVSATPRRVAGPVHIDPRETAHA